MFYGLDMIENSKGSMVLPKLFTNCVNVILKLVADTLEYATYV